MSLFLYLVLLFMAASFVVYMCGCSSTLPWAPSMLQPTPTSSQYLSSQCYTSGRRSAGCRSLEQSLFLQASQSWPSQRKEMTRALHLSPANNKRQLWPPLIDQPRPNACRLSGEDKVFDWANCRRPTVWSAEHGEPMNGVHGLNRPGSRFSIALMMGNTASGRTTLTGRSEQCRWAWRPGRERRRRHRKERD